VTRRLVSLRTLRAVVVGATILASIVVLASPAGATPGSSETIVLQRNSSFQTDGWSSSGAFADAGSWTADFGAFGAGPIFAGTIKTTETGANGTFEMVLQVQGSITAFLGTWQITGGTGAYAGLHGSGSWSFHSDNTGERFYTCTGSVHWEP
jgi:hypothetical protein